MKTAALTSAVEKLSATAVIDYRVVPAGTDDVYAAGADANHHATEEEADETIAALRALGGEFDHEWDVIEVVTGYTYQEQPGGPTYRVEEADMIRLGERLLAGEPDAYSLWCASTDVEEVETAGDETESEGAEEADAFARLREIDEDEEVSDEEARALFRAIFRRAPDADDGDAGELLSHCYAAMPAEKAVRCECGEVTGDACAWCGSAADLMTVETMPEHLRASHEAAGNRGTYPHNGAVRLRVSPECAALLVESDGGWTSIA